MNKKELLAALSEESGESQVASEAVLNALVSIVEKEVFGKGEMIRLTGFGTFSRRDVSARTARNPRTGELVQIPAKQKNVFKFSKTFCA